MSSRSSRTARPAYRGETGNSAFRPADRSAISSEERRNGTTVTPAARRLAISASTIVFSPDGWPEAYRLCAITTLRSRSPLSLTRERYRGRVPELPEVEALAADLRERVVGKRIQRVDVSAI